MRKETWKMSLFQMLLKTYEYAESQHLVDRVVDPKIPTILPIYHSNRKSTGKLDIVEITLSEKGEYLDGRFMEEGEFIVFPITEGSSVRTANTCPHPIFDNFEYVAGSYGPNKDKHKSYLEQLEKIALYERKHPNSAFKAIYNYVTNHDVREDVLDVLKKTTAGYDYNHGDLIHENAASSDVIAWRKEGKNGKEKIEKVTLSKIFVIFNVELPNMNNKYDVARDLHQFYIDYVNDQIEHHKSQFDYCDISGEKQYCVSKHCGVIGRAKLIGLSNHTEAYRGRFKTGEEVVHVGYKTSQKVHNMLKFLMDSKSFSRYIGGDSYIISWLSHDLLSGGMPITTSQISYEEDTDEDEDEIDSFSSEAVLGANRSKSITEFLSGLKNLEDSDIDNYFCVLMIEKVNKGRVAIKYFRNFKNADIKRRVSEWFKGLEWPVYSPNLGRWITLAPSLFSITNVLIGDDSPRGIAVSSKKEKIRVNMLERLMGSMLDGKILPRDLMVLSFHRIVNPATFKYHLSFAHRITCSLIKKYKIDHQITVVDEKGVLAEMDDRSFIYGRILAVYDQMESYAMKLRNKGSSGTASARPTNANRLWTAMIQRPQKTAMELQKRTQYSRAYLLKEHRWFVTRIDQVLAELYSKIFDIKKDAEIVDRPVNEDFILGFYYQKQQSFAKSSNQAVKKHEVISDN